MMQVKKFVKIYQIDLESFVKRAWKNFGKIISKFFEKLLSIATILLKPAERAFLTKVNIKNLPKTPRVRLLAEFAMTKV